MIISVDITRNLLKYIYKFWEKKYHKQIRFFFPTKGKGKTRTLDTFNDLFF